MPATLPHFCGIPPLVVPTSLYWSGYALLASALKPHMIISTLNPPYVNTTGTPNPCKGTLQIPVIPKSSYWSVASQACLCYSRLASRRAWPEMPRAGGALSWLPRCPPRVLRRWTASFAFIHFGYRRSGCLYALGGLFCECP